jgi:hypothetical protein
MRARLIVGALLSADNAAGRARSAAEFNDSFEHVAGQLFGVNDVAKVVQRGAAFPHVFERDVVLPKYLMCFLVRHSSPVLKTALEHGQTGRA